MLLLLALLVLLAAAPTASAQVTVRETTVISGTSTGWVDVRVPEGVDVRFRSETGAPPEGIVIERPAARLAAVALQRTGFPGRPTALVTRFPDDLTFEGLFAYSGSIGDDAPTLGRVPADVYRLQLHTEPGVRTTAIMTFEGAPPGRLELEPERALPDFAVVRPANTLSGVPGGFLLSARAERRTPGAATVLVAAALRGRAPGLWRASACIYGDDGSLPEAKEAPTCTPARVSTALSEEGGGSGGNAGGAFVPAGVDADSWTRPTAFGSSGGSVLTGTISVQALGAPPPSMRPIVAWFDLGPPAEAAR